MKSQTALQRRTNANPYSRDAFKKDNDSPCNLIVNSLPKMISQDEVKAIFTAIGPVKNCKLMRNHQTGAGLGYAFVEYFDEEHANLAIEKIDGTKLEGKFIHVSKKVSAETAKRTNCYVAGLPKTTTEEEFRKLFEKYGKIETIKLVKNEASDECKGIGFVRYSIKEEAEGAIEAMNGKILPGSTMPLTVRFAIPPAKSQEEGNTHGSTGSVGFVDKAVAHLHTPLTAGAALAGGAAKSMGYPLQPGGMGAPGSGHASLTGTAFTLYVYGLQPTCTELILYELFSPFGGILNVKVVRDLLKEEKPCKGFGFVNFRKYEDAQNALVCMNQYPYDNKTLQVSFKTSRGATPLQPFQGVESRNALPQGIGALPQAINALPQGINGLPQQMNNLQALQMMPIGRVGQMGQIQALNQANPSLASINRLPGQVNQLPGQADRSLNPISRQADSRAIPQTNGGLLDRQYGNEDLDRLRDPRDGLNGARRDGLGSRQDYYGDRDNRRMTPMDLGPRDYGDRMGGRDLGSSRDFGPRDYGDRALRGPGDYNDPGQRMPPRDYNDPQESMRREMMGRYSRDVQQDFDYANY